MQNTTDINQPKLSDFLTPEFISKYSNFIDAEHLFNESNFKIISEEDIDEILYDEFNKFITDNTFFDSWNEMKVTAMSLYFEK